MILKIMSLFLIGMMVLAMFGKCRLPKIKKPNLGLASRLKCKKCGMPRIVKGPCPCEDKTRI